MSNEHERAGIVRRRVLCVVASLAAAALGGCPGTAKDGRRAQATVTVAAAADLKFAMEELLAEFRKANPEVEVKVTYGSSGNFFAQVSNGAPFDVFLSADVEYPRRLAEKGLGDGGVFHYAVGRIVVWMPRDSKAAPGMDGLLDARVRKVAIANPAHAPYGRAAVAAMKSLGVYGKVQGKLVYGENVAQAAQFVQSGAAEAGIIALSLAMAPAMRDAGRYWEIPLEAYPRIDQGGIILKRAGNLDTARRLRDLLGSREGKAVLKRYGFFLPGE